MHKNSLQLSARLLLAIGPLLLLAGCASAPTAKPVTGTAEASAQPAPTPDRDVMSALMAGEMAWQDGHPEAAAKHYARAAGLSDDPKIAEQATRVALASRQVDLAIEALARWRALAPQSSGVIQSEVGLALLQGNTEAASRSARALLALGQPGRDQLTQVLTSVATADQALPLVEQLALGTPAPGEPESYVLLGRLAQHFKKDDLTLKIAERGVEQMPKDASLRAWRGGVRARGGDAAGARADLDAALKLDPDNRIVRLAYAAVLDELGDTSGAATALSRGKPDDEILSAWAAYAAKANDLKALDQCYVALKALPEPRPATRTELLGQLAELLKRPADALKWYQVIGRNDAQYLDAQLRIAVVRDDLGEGDEALKALLKLRDDGIEDDDKLAETFLLEAELLNRHQRKSDAMAAYDHGLNVLPDNKRLLYARALAAEQDDQVEKSVADLRRIVELDPNDADSLNALGYTLADRTDRYGEARELIEKALKLKPDEPAIIDSLGWVNFRSGKLAEAETALTRAFALKPDPEIASHLGEVLWSAGKLDEARKVFEQGRKIDPKNRTLLKTIERLKP